MANEEKTNKTNELSPGFSIYQFKKWLDENESGLPTLNLNKIETDIDKTLGLSVCPKVSDSKILERMENMDGAKKEVFLTEFKSAATVLKSYGKRVTILTESGTFSIPRFCANIEKKK
jgi:hypothetical protein